MEIKQYNRITFPVNAVQVSLQNIEEVAEWCGGTIEQRPTKMMGTVTDLPVIRLKGQGDNRGKEFEAALGCWVVELKGSFRSYKAAQFDSSFEPAPVTVGEIHEEIAAATAGIYCDAPPTEEDSNNWPERFSIDETVVVPNKEV